MQLTKKQNEVLSCVANEDPIILILNGAKRAGKTFILNLIYLAHIAKFENKGYAFILGGTTYSSIRRNVLNDWENILGVDELKIKDDGHIPIFGNKVYVLPGGDASSYTKVRGFTSYGAMLNEATTLHNTYIKECITRCSGEGARIYMDTNPENPTHTVKVDYIDKDGDRLPNGKLNIKSFHFTLFDNEFLSEEYVNSIIRSTPAGMFADRDIYGRWVSPEGVVYRDFKTDHIITRDQIKDIQFKAIWGGVDWGYSHYGAIVIVGVDFNNTFYVLENHAAQFQEIDYWVDKAKDLIKKYGNINFYCDSARPEHVARFQREKIKAFNANKQVLTGIETVAKLFKNDRLFIVVDPNESKKSKILTELNLYCWDEKAGVPLKVNDDALDALRYAIYSYYLLNPKVFNF